MARRELEVAVDLRHSEVREPFTRDPLRYVMVSAHSLRNIPTSVNSHTSISPFLLRGSCVLPLPCGLNLSFFDFKRGPSNHAGDYKMATKAALKRVSLFIIHYNTRVHRILMLEQLTREYQNIQKNPPPFIVAHPSESNILE